jgi:hypothetical protein
MRPTASQRDCCHPQCDAPRWFEAPFALCERHYIEVARHYELKFRNNPDRWKNLALFATNQPPRPHRVYFIQFGDRVKIGYTANLRRRMVSLPKDRILKVIEGNRHTEGLWHEKWKHLRVTGEWFTLTPELQAAIDAEPAAPK